MKIFSFLAQTKTLYFTFSLTLVLTAIFGIVMHFGQFGIIDEMFIAEDINAHIEAMSLHQRSLHAWLTGTIDVLYPFAYGAFFIGIAVKCFRRFGFWLALPSILVIPADLFEGVSQVMLLIGREGFMDLKLIATPIKLILYLFGLGVTVIGLVLALVGHVKKSKVKIVTKVPKERLISKVWVRLIVVAIFYFCILGIAGSWLIFHYVYDIAATYYSMGIFSLPVALLIVFFFDRWVAKKAWFKGKPARLVLVQLILCCPLYYILINVVIVVWYGIAGVLINA